MALIWKKTHRNSEQIRYDFIGPNCLGVANPHHKLNTTFLRYEGKPGFIGMASQSGSFVTPRFSSISHSMVSDSVRLLAWETRQLWILLIA